MIRSCVAIRHGAPTLLALAALSMPGSFVHAHHSSQAEFGPFGSPTAYVEGRIVSINWGNPHISIDIQTTGGAIPAGEHWRLVSHPIRIMEEYGFQRSDFAVGDSVKLHTWLHVRNQPLMWPRAISVNDGPMRSNLRFTDMIDIANGVFESLNIVVPLNLNGSPPGRAGADTVAKLGAMGLLDDNGLMIWPPPARTDDPNDR
jgi:hypothetical protein